MKKVLLILVIVFGTILLTSCVDESDKLEEQLENAQLIDPNNDGKIKHTDPEDDGE